MEQAHLLFSDWGLDVSSGCEACLLGSRRTGGTEGGGGARGQHEPGEGTASDRNDYYASQMSRAKACDVKAVTQGTWWDRKRGKGTGGGVAGGMARGTQRITVGVGQAATPAGYRTVCDCISYQGETKSLGRPQGGSREGGRHGSRGQVGKQGSKSTKGGWWHDKMWSGVQVAPCSCSPSGR